MGKNKKRVSNNKKAKRGTSTEKPSLSKSNLLLDFSFYGLYHSVKRGEFTNYLTSESEFIEQFKSIRRLNFEISEKVTFIEILNDSSYHCHKFGKDENNLVLKLIKDSYIKSGGSDNNYIDQLTGNETMYQLGMNGSLRLVGFYDEGRAIFKVCLIDYWHKIYPDDKFNIHANRDLKYCPMS